MVEILNTVPKFLHVATELKATEQYFPVVLFIVLYEVVLTFESLVEILKCDHSNESYWAELSCTAAYYVAQGCSNFQVCAWNLIVWPFKWKLVRVLSCGTVYLVRSSVFLACQPNPMMLLFKSNLSTSTFTWYALFVSTENKNSIFSSILTRYLLGVKERRKVVVC